MIPREFMNSSVRCIAYETKERINQPAPGMHIQGEAKVFMNN